MDHLLARETLTIEISGPDGKLKDRKRMLITRPLERRIEAGITDPIEKFYISKIHKGENDDRR